jgi:NAD dependent epimerase/dehydratase family enzyme
MALAPMRVVIAGGSGFLGQALTKHLLSQRHEVVILSRGGSGKDSSGARTVTWAADGTTGAWAKEIESADAIVNLSGAGIADKRWSMARKILLQDSRVLSARSLVEAIRAAGRKPAVFIQATAVGFTARMKTAVSYSTKTLLPAATSSARCASCGNPPRSRSPQWVCGSS